MLLMMGIAQAACGFLLVRHEVRRRKNRTTFCIRGSRIGVYRGGKLETEAAPGDLESFDPSTQFISFAGRLPGNSPRLIRYAVVVVDVFVKFVGMRIKAFLLAIPLLMCCLGGLGLAMAWFKPDENTSAMDQLNLIVIVASGAASFASVLWTGVACRSFLLRREARGPERFIAPRAKAKRLAEVVASAASGKGATGSARDIHPF